MDAGAMDQEPWLARSKNQVYIYQKPHISRARDPEPRTESQGTTNAFTRDIYIGTTILHDGNQKFSIQSHSLSQSRLEAKVDYRTA